MTNKAYIPIPVEVELPLVSKENPHWTGIVVRENEQMYKALYTFEAKEFWSAQNTPDTAGKVTHWLKEVDLPTEKELRTAAFKNLMENKEHYIVDTFVFGGNHILNLLKAK